jgi:RNA polymerase sigma-70 factor (ECF subfamily)
MSVRHLRRPGAAVASRAGLDAESRAWWERLHAPEPVRSWAIAELHELLRREAAFHIRLRVRRLSGFPRGDIDDLAVQAADDALVVLLRKLEDYRGDSQFWTWARRFVALEAPVSIRRRLGRDPAGIAQDPEVVLGVPDRGASVAERVELRERVRTLSALIAGALTARQRRVMVAVAIDGVPARTVADELHTTPGAVYKTLHDARRSLRAQLAA